jgi:hypothetical protein
MVGPSGTEKSSKALRLLEHCRANHLGRGLKGFFFWNFRYSYDALSGLEAAVCYMGGKPDWPGRLGEQVVELLKAKRYFVVFAGVERFLREKYRTGNIVGRDRSLRRLFSSLTSSCRKGEMRSILVLTTRHLPSQFNEFRSDAAAPRAKDNILIDDGQGLTYDKIRERLSKKGPHSEKVAEALHSWFKGHRYGIDLAISWLRAKTDEAKGQKDDGWFADLEYSMAESDPEHRVEKMIGIVVKTMRETPQGRDAFELLERLAMPIEPVHETVAAEIWRYLKGTGDHYKIIKLLTDSKLLFCFANARACGADYECDGTHYMVLPTVRQYIFHHFHHSSAMTRFDHRLTSAHAEYFLDRTDC